MSQEILPIILDKLVNPTTPSGLTVGVGKQAQQSNPNSNNEGSNNGSA
jgi:hypothetical protein